MRPETATTKRSWPIGSGIFLIVVMLLIWLNYGRLLRKFGLSSRDLSSIPLARQISADEMQRIRVGASASVLASKPNIDPLTAPAVASRTSARNSSNFAQSGNRFAPPIPDAPIPASTILDAPEKSNVAQVNFEQPEFNRVVPSQTKRLDAAKSARQQSSPLETEKPPTNFRQKFPEFNQVLPNSSSGPANELVRIPKSAPAPQPDDCETPQCNGTVEPPTQTFTVVEPENLTQDNQTDDQPSNHDGGQPPETSIVNLTVIGGETWWTIAQDHYGNGHYFRALYRHNRKNFPDYERIPVGSIIELPNKSVLEKQDRELNGEKLAESENNVRPLYITRDGDSLFEIARQQLGQASRYLEIRDLNRSRLPSRVGHLEPLPAGTQLFLPE